MTDPMTTWAPPEGGPAPSTLPAGTTSAGTTSAGTPSVALMPLASEPVAPAPAPVAPMPLATPPAKGSGRATNILLGVAVVVAVAGLAFAGGRVTAPASASGFQGVRGGLAAGSFDPNQAGSFDPNQAGLGGSRAVTITGTVNSLDGSTLVLTAADGTEMTIDVSGSTYHAETAATASDVTSGTSVSVTVTGIGGFRGPNASAAPNGDAGNASIKASDVIITGK